MQYRQANPRVAAHPAFEPLEPRLLLANYPIITEFMAINGDTFADWETDTPDWIELHNPTSSTVNLVGWKLRDTGHEWTFPSFTLSPGQYRVVFASGKDLVDPNGYPHTQFGLDGDGEYLALVDPSDTVVQEFFPNYPKQLRDVSYGLGDASVTADTLVGEGTSLTAFVPPDDDLGQSWTGGSPFDDSEWIASDTSVGYDLDGDYVGLIETDLQDAMCGQATSAFLRYSFEVAYADSLTNLTLRVRYDDAFVAYLNGVEIARRDVIDPLSYASTAEEERDDQAATLFEDIDVSAYLSEVSDGENILAVHALTAFAADRDFLFAADLLADRELEGGEVYFTTPTPEGPNVQGTYGQVGDTKFGVDRGFYDEWFDVTITTGTPGAEIHYTVDGSEPTATTGELYEGPIRITTTTTLQAAAFKPGYLPTNVDAQTYIFPDHVLDQTRPDGYPVDWVSSSRTTAGDYEMDPRIVDDAVYSQTIRDDLLSLPTLSIVMDRDDLFEPGGQGIYLQGSRIERACSLEMIYPDGTEGFQINCSVQIQGGTSTNRWKCEKLSMRVKFKEPYGPTKLDFPFFDDPEATDSFDTLVLDARMNNVWIHSGDAGQRARCQYTRDEFVSRLQNATGGYGPHGRYVQLYLNGLYWGMYWVHERPDESYNASYRGGEKEDYDVLKHSSSTIVNGTNTDYMAMYNLSAQASNPATYEVIRTSYLDVPRFIDYMLVNFYVGNTDWAHHNWYASRNTQEPGNLWQFHSWDAEHVLEGEGDNVVGRNNNGAPTGLHMRLRANAEYKMLFADHVHRHLFNDGVMTVENATAVYQDILDEIERAIVTESARWGDAYTSTPYTWDDWARERDRLLNDYFPQDGPSDPSRTDRVIAQLQSAGLYPRSSDVVAPTFHVNGAYQHGGEFAEGDLLTMSTTLGQIYYTLDGTDPRLPGGGISPDALPYDGAVELTESVRVKARALNGATWSALDEAVYVPDVPPTLRISELMYNPPQPTAEEEAADFRDKELFEFIELRNVGDEPLALGGFRLRGGVTFTFPEMELQAGHYVLVAADPAAFEFRYGTSGLSVAGTYTDVLNNAGEHIVLESDFGAIIHDFTYDDAWEPTTDGDGYSLTIRDELGDLAMWPQAEGWKPSGREGGTPGAGDDGMVPGSVIINEVLAHSDGGVEDWIELYNTTDQDIDIGGWFLSDSGLDLTQYQIPPGTVIMGGHYLVFNEIQHFGPDVNPTGFRLSELGEDVYLCSNVGGEAGGYREHVDFGASPNSMTFGAYVKTTGTKDFALLAEPTPYDDNAEPVTGPLVINELMYHPEQPPQPSPYNNDDYEFVELYNRSGETLTLTQFVVGGGVGFTFGWYDTDTAGTAAWTLQDDASATWQATLSEAGDYEVLVWLDPVDAAGRPRSLDAEAWYRINHDGGPTFQQIDQNVLTAQWVSLGTYSFAAGDASVTLNRGSDDAAEWTLADRVRFVKGPTTVEVDNADDDFTTTGSPVTTLLPGQYVVLVKDLEAFDERYDIAGNGIPVAGEYTGNLGNGGDRIKVSQAWTPDPTGYVPYVRGDHVNYNDRAPWPLEPDGTGASLNRRLAEVYGNEPTNWAPSSSGGTPGALNAYIDSTPPSVPTGVLPSAYSHTEIDLHWTASVDAESGVNHYVIYRNGAYLDTATGATYRDSGLDETQTYSYEISAVNRDGYESARSAAVDATPRPSLQSAFPADEMHVTVVFGKAVELSSAQVKDNYTLRDDQGQEVAIFTAIRQADWARVSLTLPEALTEDMTYTLQVSGVRDLADNAVKPNSQTVFTFTGADPNLLAWWTFDEGEGGTAHDASGNGNDAQLLGATWTGGRIGGALSFDGNDRVVDGDAEAYLNGLEAVTVAMWVRFTGALPTDRGFFTTHETSNDCLNIRYDAAASNASSLVKVYFYTTVDDPQYEGSGGTQTSDWQHVAVTWISGEPMQLYLDGQLDDWSRSPGAVGGVMANCNTLWIGKGCYDPWIGLIDDVRVYNTALSAQEIAELANLEPMGLNDGYEVDQDGVLGVVPLAGVLANDTDPDDGPQALTGALLDNVDHGQLIFQTDGSFGYIPTAGYHGPDEFSYRPFDGLEYGNVVTVSITVRDTTPPVVTDFRRNGGEDRIGNLDRIDIRFDEDVSASLDIDDLIVHNDSTGQTVNLNGVAAFSYDAGTHVATWDLSGVAIEPGHHSVSLKATGVMNAYGLRLDGDGNGTGGDDYQTALTVAIPGDTDLDGVVGMLDYLVIKTRFGMTGATWADGDSNYDGEVTYEDYIAAKDYFGQSISAGAAEVLGTQAPATRGSAEADGDVAVPPASSAALLDEPLDVSPAPSAPDEAAPGAIDVRPPSAMALPAPSTPQAIETTYPAAILSGAETGQAPAGPAGEADDDLVDLLSLPAMAVLPAT